MPQLQAPGALLNYEVWPAPDATPSHSAALPWLTLVNGHTRPLSDFRMMSKMMVAAGFRVVALDNRGAGKTEITDEFTLDDMVADIVLLWRELGIAKTHLLGISMGGFLSQRLAAEKPEIVSKLILVSTAPGPNFIRVESKPWTADVGQVEEKLLPYFTEDFANRNRMLIQSMAKQITQSVTKEYFAQRSDMQRRALSGFDMTKRLKEIQAPTLVIHGLEDQIIEVKAARELVAGIPHAKLELVSDAGHLLLAEKPQELYRRIKEFLAKK
jgi:3-oxoadipate enol-lactonase